MTTAYDIVALALKSAGVLGVGQTALAEDANDGLTFLNMMMAQWQAKRQLVYHLVDLVAPSTGASVYTIGPTGDFIVAERPTSIAGAFVRRSGTGQPVDYPLSIIKSREDYNLISLKSLASFPSCLFYDSAFPLGNLYFWPIPDSSFELHVSAKETLGAFADLTSQFNLPSEYREALHYNLTVRLMAHYDRPADPVRITLAKLSLNTIRNANAQIPELLMPDTLSGRSSSGLAAIYSGV